MTAGRYEFGAATEDRSVVLGLRATQVAIMGVGLVTAVGAVRATGGTASGFAGALVVVAFSAVASLWPVAGRTLDQWAPLAIGWAARRILRRHRHISTLPLLGHDAQGQTQNWPPPTLNGVRIFGVPIEGAGSREVGVLHDRWNGTYAAVLAVRGSSFQLADSPDRHRRLAAWGSVLAGLARVSSPIHRIQWIERTAPEDGDAMGQYLAASRRVPRDHPSLESYLELVDGAGPAAPAHEALLVVSLSATRARRVIRQAGGGPTGAVQVLVREMQSLRRQLAAADLSVDGVLTPRLLASSVRAAFEPHSRAALARRAAASGTEGGTDSGNA